VNYKSRDQNTSPSVVKIKFLMWFICLCGVWLFI